MRDQEDWFECFDCHLIFTITANNDYSIMSGDPFVVHCPRCGSDNLSEVRKEKS